jgi:O-antigen/teichoic acid export membrane protein
VRAIADPTPEPAPLARTSVGRVARNTGAATIAQIANALAGYVLLYLVASLLGRTGVGILGVVMSIGLIGQIAATLGIYVYLPRIVAQHPEQAERAFGTALAVTGAASLGVFGITAALIGLGMVPRSEAPLAIVGALAIVPGAAAMVCEGFITGHERITLTALSNVIEGLARLAIMPVLLLGFGWGLYAAAAAWVIGRCLGVLVDLVLIRTIIGSRPRVPDLKAVRPMLAAAIPLSGGIFLYLLFGRADVPIVAALAGTDAVGLLVGGYRPVEILLMVPISMITSLYPALTRELSRVGDHAQRMMEKVLILALVPIAGATVGLVFESDFVTRILYPPALHASSSVLSISAWVLIPATIDAAATALLLAQGRFKLALAPLALGVLTLVVLNILLDRGMGAEGAAIARVAAQVVALGSKMALIIRFYLSRYLISRLAGIAVAMAVLAAVLMAGGRIPLVAIAVGTLTYLVIVAALKVVSVADLAGLRGGRAPDRQPEAAGTG